MQRLVACPQARCLRESGAATLASAVVYGVDPSPGSSSSRRGLVSVLAERLSPQPTTGVLDAAVRMCNAGCSDLSIVMLVDQAR
jgi:hypothetical protein